MRSYEELSIVALLANCIVKLFSSGRSSVCFLAFLSRQKSFQIILLDSIKVSRCSYWGLLCWYCCSQFNWIFHQLTLSLYGQLIIYVIFFYSKCPHWRIILEVLTARSSCVCVKFWLCECVSNCSFIHCFIYCFLHEVLANFCFCFSDQLIISRWIKLHLSTWITICPIAAVIGGLSESIGTYVYLFDLNFNNFEIYSWVF